MIKPPSLPRGTLPTERGELDTFGNPTSPRKPKTLINFRSNLRSFKHGSGRGEPFIWTPLPSYGNFATSVYLGEDSLGRTGIRNAAATDVIRLNKFLQSGRGLIFQAKQKALTTTRVQTPYAPIRLYNANNLVLQAGLQGTGVRINSLGLNPFTTRYESYEYLTKTLYQGENNRLVLLYDSKVGNTYGSLKGTQKAVATLFGISPIKNTLFSYPGGPGGLATIITQDKDHRTTNYKPNEQKGIYVLTNKQLHNKKFSGNNVNILTSGLLFDTTVGGTNITNFIKEVNDSVPSTPTSKRILGRTTDYEQFNRQKFGIADEGNNANLDRQAYDKDKPLITKGVDKLNLKKVYSSAHVDTTEGTNTTTKDLVKFYIGVVDNANPLQKTYIHFRAYLNNFSDAYSAEWSGFRYPGRGEELYRYSGFVRDISFGFKVLVGSKAELFPTYQKLNYLASIMAPDYSDPGFMRGNIVQLTIGDYINDLYGVIQGFTYTIPEDSPWDIARKDDGTLDKYAAELPQLIDVSGFTFKPIHDFVPRTVRDFDNPESKFISMGSSHRGYKSENQSV